MKFEVRSSSQIRSSNIEADLPFAGLIQAWNFELISSFGFRVSFIIRDWTLVIRHCCSLPFGVVFSDAALARADEFHQIFDFSDPWQFLLNPCQTISYGEAFAEDDLVSLAQGVNPFFGNPVALETDF